MISCRKAPSNILCKSRQACGALFFASFALTLAFLFSWMHAIFRVLKSCSNQTSLPVQSALDLPAGEREAEIFGGDTKSAIIGALQDVLRSRGQPLSIFELQVYSNLPRDSDTCRWLLSFLKQRPEIFQLSSNEFGCVASLEESNELEDILENGEEVDEERGESESDENLPGADIEESFEPSMGNEVNEDIASHLSSLLQWAGGSAPLAFLEWDDVCMARFTSHLDLEDYLEEHPDFNVWTGWRGAK